MTDESTPGQKQANTNFNPWANNRLVLDALTGLGVGQKTAVGAMGSLAWESGPQLNNTALNRGDGSDGSDSIGWGQWNGPRAIKLRETAASMGLPVSDPRVQVQHIKNELTGDKYGHVLDALKQQDDVNYGADVWTRQYEVPKVINSTDRAQRGLSIAKSMGVDVGSNLANPYMGRLVDPSASVRPDFYKSTSNPSYDDTMGAFFRNMDTYHAMRMWSDNSTAPDPNFRWTPELLDEKTKGLTPDQSQWLVDNAHSAGHVDLLLNRLDQQRQDDDTLSAHWYGAPMRFASSVLDPIGLLAGFGAGKAVQLGGVAASRLGRAAQGGLVGLATGLPGQGIEAAYRPSYGLDDFLMNAASGIALGSAFGSLGHAQAQVGNDVHASIHNETQDLMEHGAKQVERQVFEANGAKITPEGEAFYSPKPRDLGAGAPQSEEVSSALKAGRIDAHGQLLHEGNVFVKELAQKMMPDSVGTGGKVLGQDETAFEWMQRHYEGIEQAASRPVQDAFDLWAKDQGLNLWGKVTAKDEFLEQVGRAIYDPPSAQHPAVTKAADAYRDQFRTILTKAKEAGADWAKNVGEDDWYFPIMFDREKVRALTAKYGEEGLTSVIKQGFLSANPQFGDFFATRYANSAGKKAGRVAETAERKAEAPVIRGQRDADIVDATAARAEDQDVIRQNARSEHDELREHAQHAMDQAKADRQELIDQATVLRAEARSKTLAESVAQARNQEADRLTQMGDGLLNIAREASEEAVEKVRAAREAHLAATRDEHLVETHRVKTEARRALKETLDEAFTNAFRAAFDARFGDVKNLYADRVAAKYVKSVRAQTEGTQALLANATAGADREALKRMLVENGLSNVEADLAVEMTKSASKSGPGHFRRRAPIDDTQAFTPEGFSDSHAFSLRDLTNQNAEEVFNKYARQTLGHAAMAKEGFQSRGAYASHIMEITKGLANTIPGYTDSIAKKNHDILEMYGKRIYGDPVGDFNSTGYKAAQMLGNLNFARFMTQSGIAQLHDAPKIVLRNGIRAAWDTFSLGDVARAFSKGSKSLRDTLARDLEVMTGLGAKTARNKVLGTFRDVDEFYPDSRSEVYLDRAVNMTRRAANLTANVSLMNPITDFLHRWSTRATLQHFLDVAQGKAKYDAKLMNDAGMSKEMLDRVGVLAKNMTFNDRGVLVDLNKSALEKIDGEALDVLMARVTREAKAQILETNPGNVPSFMQGQTGRLMMQFKSFMFASYAANTLHNIKMGYGYAAKSLVMGMAWSSLVHMLTTYEKSIGRADQKDYLDEHLNLKALIAASFERTSDSSVIPSLYDTAALIGEKVSGHDDLQLFNKSRTSNLASNFVTGNPTNRTLSDLFDVATTIPADLLRGDRRLTQQDFRKALSIAPLANTYGIANAIQGLTDAYLPTKQPH